MSGRWPAGVHLPPEIALPEVPAGWVTGPPDFVGVGAQRCGTTRWYRLITAHPGVHRGYGKEQHYFGRFWELPFGDQEIEGYGRRFPRPADTLIGEWSPRYMSDFWTPPLLAAAAPAARLLVLLRDPLARFRSGIAKLRRKDGKLVSDLRNGVEQAQRGCYATQLETLYSHFRREQILVQQFERCVASPREELARAYRFLGLDDDFAPDALHERVNAAEHQKELTPHVERALLRLYEPELARLPELAPDVDLALWPSASLRRAA